MTELLAFTFGGLVGWACGLFVRIPWYFRKANSTGAPLGYVDVLALCPDAYVSYETKPDGATEWRVHDITLGGAVTAPTPELLLARLRALRSAT